MYNVIFFGSDRYSTIVLKSLLSSVSLVHGSADLHVTLCVTTPPRAAGRKAKMTANPVEIMANERNIKVIHYPDKSEEMSKFLNSLNLTPETVGLSASFPRLMPPNLVYAFDGRLYNIHPSLLPQYRNVAPVPFAVAMGDTVTGVSIFEIGNGIDNGQIVAQTDEPIHPSDTTPLLLTRLFSLGTDLFMRFLTDPSDPSLTAGIRIMRSADLIFTRRLTRESGFIEWPVVQKLIGKLSITPEDTANHLIKLRLTHYPDRTKNILLDLIRALDGYEKVWTIAETKKGKIQISLSSNLLISPELLVLISGKPKPIPWTVFTQNYL